MGRYFGTDGIRGIVGETLSEEFAERLGAAAGRVIAAAARRKVTLLVGRDTRPSGPMLEAALVRGLCASGADVIRAEILPTPGVAYATCALGLDAGAVISASHNPSEYNGIKFFDGRGFKLADEIEAAIEAELEAPHPGATLRGEVSTDSAIARYERHLLSLAEQGLVGRRIVLDCAYGAAHDVAPRVFEAMGAQVIALNAEASGDEINAGCGALHPEAMARAVVAHRAHLGLAFDGDADRVIFSDERGRIVDGDQVLAMCAADRVSRDALPGKVVVGTQVSNLGLEIALREMGCALARARVGDRYVLEEMQRRGAVMGGEPSGHTIFLDHATTGDGLLTAIVVCNLMRRQGKSLSALAVMERVPQTCINVAVERRADLSADPVIVEAIQSASRALGERGRLVVRPSGTEPVVRVMVEGLDLALVQQVAEGIAQTIQARCA